MKILVDVQACQGENRHKGLGRFAFSLCNAVLAVNQLHDFHLLMNGSFPEAAIELRQHFSQWVPIDRIHVFFPIGSVKASDPENTWRNMATAIVRQSVVDAVEPDCVLILNMFEGYNEDTVVSVPKDRRIPVVSMLYGIPWTKTDVGRNGQLFENFCGSKISELARVDRLIGISGHAIDQAAKHFNLNKKDTAIIGPCVGMNPDLIPETDDSAVLDRLGIREKYVLCALGDFDAAENVGKLLSTWGTLPRPLRTKYQLVLASKEPDVEMIRRFGRDAAMAAQECRFTGHLGNADLLSVCRKCELFVFLSLHEGFCFSLLEAIACGAPAIASKSSDTGELHVDAKALFDPKDQEDIARLLRRCLEDDEFRLSLRMPPPAPTERPTCEGAATKCLAYFDQIAQQIDRTVRYRGKEARRPLDIDATIASLAVMKASRVPKESDFIEAAVSLAHQVERVGKRRLFIDVSTIVKSDLGTGIQRVVRSVVELLPGLLQERCQAILVYGDERCRFRKANAWLAGQSDYQSYVTDGGDDFIDARKGDILVGLDYAPYMYPRFDPELARLRTIGVRIYFVVYDLIPLRHPEFVDDGLARAFNSWLSSVAHSADGLLCISRSVLEDLRNWIRDSCPEREKTLRIKWFHLGANFVTKRPSLHLPTAAAAIMRKLTATPSFLMVGTLEPRKGHGFVLDAFDQLWRHGSDVNLVFVGKLGWMMEHLGRRIGRHQENNRRLYWLDGINDEYLDAVYSGSAALVAASVAEGFGLPIIEAAQRGLPVIARDIPIFREIAGEGAVYFDGISPDNLAKTILDFLHGGSVTDRVARVAKIKWLTWEESARNFCSLLLGD